jgi:GMP synthase (glutamine-hydrolysing)
MRSRLAFLNVAHDGAETRRNFRRELAADLVEYDASGGDLPPDLDVDGVVVTGSRASVYWDEDWIDPLTDYVGRAVAAGVPVLGVCYGHQVLAAALGGEVADMGAFELGYRTVELTADDPLFDGIDDEFTVFTTHGDTVTRLPPGAEALAENEYGLHAFRYGDSWGVQFHPEYDLETADRVARKKEGEVDQERFAAVLDGITPENHAAACEAKALFDNFVAHVERVVAEGEADAEPGPEPTAE